jgi:cytochrome bd-type quinol oxidase subunit 2
VFVHVLAAFGFVLAHGGTALVAFRARGEREPARIAALMDLSNASLGLMYVCVIVLVAAGVAAGLLGHWFGQLWIWAAIAVLVVVAVAMLAYAAPYYQRVRVAIGQPGRARRRFRRRRRRRTWPLCSTPGGPNGSPGSAAPAWRSSSG